MNSQNISNALFIFEVLIVFAVGIFGNKIAELITIDQTPLIIITCGLLLVQIFISIWRNTNTTASTATKGISTVKILVPRTMIDAVPTGTLFGFLLSTLLKQINPSGWDILGLLLATIFLFITTAILMAILVDSHLAGAFSFGCFLGWAITMTINYESIILGLLMYVLNLILGILLAQLIIRTNSFWRQLEEVFKKTRY